MLFLSTESKWEEEILVSYPKVNYFCSSSIKCLLNFSVPVKFPFETDKVKEDMTCSAE